MLYFVIGMPCLFSDWCDAVVAELAGRIGSPAPVLAANTLDELALGLLATGACDAVIAARYGGGRLRTALIESQRPFLLVADDPGHALADLVLRKGASLPQAVSATASALATIANYAEAPGALHLDAGRHGKDLIQTVSAIAQHFGFNLAAEDLAAIANLPAPALQSDAAQWWKNLDRGQKALAGDALSGWDPAQPARVRWHCGLFQRDGQTGQTLDGSIDITGRARTLLEGPFIMLRQGGWKLVVQLAFSATALNRDYLVEVFSDHLLASRMIHPQAAGAVACDLDFMVDAAADHPISVRLSMPRAAFDGTVSLESAILEPAS